MTSWSAAHQTPQNRTANGSSVSPPDAAHRTPLPMGESGLQECLPVCDAVEPNNLGSGEASKVPGEIPPKALFLGGRRFMVRVLRGLRRKVAPHRNAWCQAASAHYRGLRVEVDRALGGLAVEDGDLGELHAEVPPARGRLEDLGARTVAAIALAFGAPKGINSPARPARLHGHPREHRPLRCRRPWKEAAERGVARKSSESCCSTHPGSGGPWLGPKLSKSCSRVAPGTEIRPGLSDTVCACLCLSWPEAGQCQPVRAKFVDHLWAEFDRAVSTAS